MQVFSVYPFYKWLREENYRFFLTMFSSFNHLLNETEFFINIFPSQFSLSCPQESKVSPNCLNIQK